MTRSNVRSAALIAAAVLGAGAVAASCGREASHRDDVGSVAVALTLSPGVVVNTVTFQIAGNGITPINGSIDVTSATRATALVPGLPAGAGYTVTMDATSVDGGTTCHGVGTFAVVAGQTASATVTLQCRGQVNGTGTVAINGRLDNCPFITSFSASSLQGVVGGPAISISVAATDFDAMDTIAYTWTAAPTGIGTFGNAAVASTTFSCTAAGTTQLSIAVSDGVCGDNRTPAIPVECILPTGGIGGRPGTGGVGTGGAGTGGMGVGGAGTGGAGTGGMGVGGAGTGGVGTGGVGTGGAGTGGAGTGGAMMVENTCTLSPPQEPVSGTPACGGCQTDNCAFGPTGTDGCCVFSDPADQLLCIRAAACFARNTVACTNAGDPTSCYCGAAAANCFTTLNAANGLCRPEVEAAARTQDPATIQTQFVSPTSPLGRAVNLTGCRGSFCASECSIR